jgi:hypothetical protein
MLFVSSLWSRLFYYCHFIHYLSKQYYYCHFIRENWKQVIKLGKWGVRNQDLKSVSLCLNLVQCCQLKHNLSCFYFRKFGLWLSYLTHVKILKMISQFTHLHFYNNCNSHLSNRREFRVKLSILCSHKTATELDLVVGLPPFEGYIFSLLFVLFALIYTCSFLFFRKNSLHEQVHFFLFLFSFFYCYNKSNLSCISQKSMNDFKKAPPYPITFLWQLLK